ncbi:MAG: SusC/RagA family TonB-linked outer membrane protein [Dysgonomonas sp.]
MKNLFSKARIIMLMLALFGMYLHPFAQTQDKKTISGTVLDNKGIPLIGVTIIIPNTSQGTTSDLDGNYSLEIPSSTTSLQFSYTGFSTQTITIGKQKVINVILQEDSKLLDEVVVVGYGVQKKSHLTGSVSKLNTEGMEDLPATRLDQALQGKIAGVNIQNVTSEAGVAPQVRVRGLGSISAGNDPLVIVDGHPTSDGLGFVEMADVESVEVLKDAASAAIYGSRAANGVIIITTKSGETNKPKYTFNTYHGVKTAYKLNPIMKYSDYVKMLYRDAAAGGVEYAGTSEKAGYILATQIIGNEVDYQKEALNDFAQIHNYQLNVSGGTKEIKYFMSGNYSSEEGIMKMNTYDKFSARIKVDAQMSKKVKVGINANPTYSKRERPSNNFTDFTRFYSWVPTTYTQDLADKINQVGQFTVAAGDYAHPRHFANLPQSFFNGYTLPDGSVYESTSTATVTPWSSQNNNPVAILNGDTRKREEYRMLTSAYAEIKFNKNLTFRTSESAYVRYAKDNEFQAYGAKKEGEPSIGTFRSYLTTDLLTENTLTYDNTFNKIHSLNVLLGATYQYTKTENAAIIGTDYASDVSQTLNYANTYLSGTGTDWYPEALESYLSRVSYSYMGKYLLSASFRTDGSSKFAKGHRWSSFPSVSLGWRATEENFLKSAEWLSNAKLRASYGKTGNNKIENYAYANPLIASNYSLGIGTGSLIPGLSLSSTLGNSILTWERTNEYNAGLDFGVINNRIALTLDYYYSITDKLLFLQPTLAYSGFGNYWNNIGKVRNRGFEIELSTVNIDNKILKWNTSVNFATNSNRLLEIGGEAAQYYTGERNEVYAAIVGGPSIQYFGYKTDGVWSQAEVDAFGTGAEASAKRVEMYAYAGALKIVDQDKNGKIDAQDRVALNADPFPDFTWGMTNTVMYKNFDFSFMIQGVQGNDIINGDAYYSENKRFNENFAKNQWVSDTQPGDGRTPNARAGGMDWMLTDYVIEDGSYIALRNISIGYKLPSKSSNKLGVKSLRFYGTVQNLLYIMASGYRGINPEYKYTSDTYSSPFIDGYQRGSFPLQRTFTVGLELTF